MFTGMHVEEHRMDEDRKLRPGNTIWEKLATDGYETAAFSYNTYLTEAPVGLADVFQTVKSNRDLRLPHPDAFDPASLNSNGAHRYFAFLKQVLQSDEMVKSLVNGIVMRTDTTTDSILSGTPNVSDRFATRSFEEWLSERDGPWAACINYMDAHVPYLPRPEHNNWAGPEELELMEGIDEHVWEFVQERRPWSQRKELERLYDGCIHQADAEVRRVINILEERSLLDDTLVVITADHGEGFGEQGEIRPARSVAHGNTGGVEEVILHVPLLVSYPEQSTSARIDRVASLTRFPKVVRNVRQGSWRHDDFVPDDGMVLSSMRELSQSERETAPEYVGDISPYEPGGRAVYRTNTDGNTRKQVRWNGTSATFDCTDPQAIKRLSDDEPNPVDEVFDTLSSKTDLTADVDEPTDEVKARLEELGYR
jgi:arylsulfatase